MNIYVGNLPYAVTSNDLENLFAQFGTVVSAKVVSDAGSGRSKGFGFVELDSEQGATTAIEELNGSDLQGRSIVVSKARPKTEHNNRGGGDRGDRRRSGPPRGGSRNRRPLR